MNEQRIGRGINNSVPVKEKIIKIINNLFIWSPLIFVIWCFLWSPLAYLGWIDVDMNSNTIFHSPAWYDAITLILGFISFISFVGYSNNEKKEE